MSTALQTYKPSDKTDVQFIKGIGPKRADILAKHGIRTVVDLLYYFPRDYLDRTRTTKIKNLHREIGKPEGVTVVGLVQDFRVVGFGAKQRFMMMLEDETGAMECVWFGGVRYYQHAFERGEYLAVFGRPDFFGGRIQIVHPDFDRLSDEEDSNFLHTGTIIPLYRSSEELKKVGLDSRGFRRIIKTAVTDKLDVITESLSPDIIQRQSLINLREAISGVHFPKSASDLAGARRRLKFDELFYLQLMLAYRKRDVKVEEKGISFNVKSTLARKVVDSLHFQLTRAQKKVIREIAEDMQSPKPMNRLLQGDVGSGKTIVALIAMLIACENGYQCAFMAPTEILAEQHHSTLTSFLKGLPIRIRVLIGRQKKKWRREILEDIEKGVAHIVVGTHALIEENVKFQNLGMAVIDEQHRFGVLQRAVLREKGYHPDVLVMTATPIPRTLSLTVYGDLDVSVIDELPKHMKPIKTMLKYESDRQWTYEFVRNEVKKGRQAYIVYPLVEESEKLDLKAATASYEHLKTEVFPEMKVGLIHGRLFPYEKDDIMNAFKAGEIEILVSTTVIEVGIDVPNATVMVIENAERFGLSQLHQLRGRVGRGSEQSYCILVAKWHFMIKNGMSDEERSELRKTQKRLETMVGTTDGFRIAEVDLEVRGPGDFFGTRQSGLPDLRIANIMSDGDILMSARKEAFALVDVDPHLRKIENAPIRSYFQVKYRASFALAKVG